MVHIPQWKIILVAVLCALGIVYAAPNMMGRKAALEWEAKSPSWAPHKTINLGLDLQGGSHLLLEVDVRSVINERINGLVDQARSALRAAQVGYLDLAAEGNGVAFTGRRWTLAAKRCASSTPKTLRRRCATAIGCW